MILRETLKRLAGIYSEQGTAISFYFKPEIPQNRAHQTESILIKDKVRELLGSLSGMPRSKAGDDVERILKLSEELRINPRPKGIFASKEHDLWIDLDIGAAPGTKLSLKFHGELAWTDKQGNAGIRFLEMDCEMKRNLQLWLEQQYLSD